MHASSSRKRARCAADDDAAESAATPSDSLDLLRRDGTAVYFCADVTKATVFKLLQLLREATACALEHAHPGRDPSVHLYVHSDGGDVFAGLSAYDHIRANRVPVTTVADGMVASAASLLLLAGETRLAMSHASVLIHQLSTGFAGKYADLLDEVQNSSALMDSLHAIYRARTDMSAKRLAVLLKKERCLDATRCLREGFVHALV
tara:strand:- start:2398 stop:3012 length:615 start_codon:yes stop_codon:yes gene_type:complete